MIVLIFGVSGCGKTTIGRGLADLLGCAFVDADDLHSPYNRAKMAQGTPLSDEDRAPWLAAVSDALAEWQRHRKSGVLACSTLKRAYRDGLRHAAPSMTSVFLDVDEQTLSQRLHDRKDHFMRPSLLASQLATLERPGADEQIIFVNADAEVSAIIDALHRAVRDPASNRDANLAKGRS